MSVVARRHDVNANQLFQWRRQYLRGELGSSGALVPVGVIGKGGIVSAVSDLAQPKPTRLTPGSPSMSPLARPSKMIEVELPSGTRIRIDADVKGLTLQQVLKFVRGLA